MVRKKLNCKDNKKQSMTSRTSDDFTVPSGLPKKRGPEAAEAYLP
jgi:hypothetical protein